MTNTSRTTRKRKPREYCRGSGRSIQEGSCPVCYRDIRTTKDGRAFKHYPKAPVTRSDPRHSKYLKDTYGITGEQYEQLLAAQDGKCYICQRKPAAKRLAVDHDHGTGYVRGLLCRRCNHRILGSANDTTEILHRAIAYLDNPPAFTVIGKCRPTPKEESIGD